MREDRTYGAMGLTFVEVDDVIQAMASCLVDRGHDEDAVREQLLTVDFDSFWTRVAGPAIDALAAELGLEAFPG